MYDGWNGEGLYHDQFANYIDSILLQNSRITFSFFHTSWYNMYHHVIHNRTAKVYRLKVTTEAFGHPGSCCLEIRCM